MKDLFLQLIRLGVGTSSEVVIYDKIEWTGLQALAEQQGLFAISLDGIGKLPSELRPEKEFLLQWIGEVMQMEAEYTAQQKAAAEMSLLFHHNAVRTYVLKGTVVSECYPNPIHRNSVDLDCFLTETVQGLKGLKSLSGHEHFDAWELGNQLMEREGYKVERSFYKNSTIYLPGLIVENHLFLTPFRGNNTLKKLECVLQTMIREDKDEDRIEGTWLYRPPVMVTALFLIEHAYSHFLHEGLTWRMVLDWMMFSRKHKDKIDWKEFDALIDEFGFRKFYDSFSRLGQYLLGEIQDSDLSKVDKKMLADIWAPLDLHETVRGWRGKLALVGNTWRARWKYKYFTDISWLTALWIQVKGYLFEKNPKLN